MINEFRIIKENSILVLATSRNLSDIPANAMPVDVNKIKLIMFCDIPDGSPNVLFNSSRCQAGAKFPKLVLL